MAIQQEFKPQTPSPPPSQSEEERDEFYEDEPRPRSWGAIASVVLALALVFVGYQWNQAAGRERLLASQVTALRADAEGLRLRAEEAQRYVDGLQRRVTAISTEKEALAERLATLEKSAQQRAVAARETPRVRATPVAAKKTR